MVVEAGEQATYDVDRGAQEGVDTRRNEQYDRGREVGLECCVAEAVVVGVSVQRGVEVVGDGSGLPTSSLSDRF